MGDNKHSQHAGQNTGRQPITQHPLFPAIVALWFGAVFGIASLAIRPALIEQFVVATGIDTVIPMAAPPLGTTTRILISLAMTALGGIIGSLIAHRLARPATAEPRARRRSAAAQEEAAEAGSSVQGFGTKTSATPAASSRRRALALNQEDGAPEIVESAPIPGHEARILNVAAFDLDGFEQRDEAAETAITIGAVAADMQSYDEETAPADGRAGPRAEFKVPDFEPPAYTPPAFHAPQDDTARLPDDAVNELAPSPEVQALTDEEPATGTEPETEEEVAPAPSLRTIENSLFQTYTREIQARAEQSTRERTPPLFGRPAPIEPARADLLPRIGLGEWGEDDPADDSFQALAPGEEPEPLFTQPVTADGESAGSAASADAPHDTGTDDPVDTADHVSAAERIAQAELGTLSHMELLERLALAMDQQRQRAAAAIEAAAAPQTATTEPVLSHVPAAEAAAEVVAPQADASDSGVVADALEEPEIAEPDASADEVPEAAPFAAPVIPAALRPVGLHADDEDALPGYVPPRHITHAVALPASVAASADYDDAAGTEDDDDGEVLDSGYSSLLDLSRPAAQRPRFVRVEEPESAAIEPVVIFPGEGTATPAPFSAPFAPQAHADHPQDHAQRDTADSAAPSDRMFDRPTGGDRQAAAKSPEETEKALRAALATLQRMSGAA